MISEIKIQSDVSLAPFTTLQVGGEAEYFAVARSEEDMSALASFARERGLPVTMIAGGSNILVSDDGVRGLVIKNEITGISRIKSVDDVLVTAGAGEEWDALVAYTAKESLWGLENLSAIPGSVGATPVQNVGAYGVEVADLIESVRVLDAATGNIKDLTPTECEFGYRNSFFKTVAGRSVIILSVTYRLSLVPTRRLHYRDLQERFAGRDNNAISITDIREAVIDIRKGKFPDWKVLGTAGSFFKNPVIPTLEYQRLVLLYPGLPGFPEPDGLMKVSLGWILDQVCSLRGHREGNVGLYEKQALVLINFGGVSAGEIKQFADSVAKKVFEKTGIEIEFEVSAV